MNEREQFVKILLEKQNHSVVKIDSEGMPDFIVDNNFYVEVKNAENHGLGGNNLSQNQLISFSQLKKPIFVYLIKNKEEVIIREFIAFEGIKKLKKMKSINEKFEDAEFEELANAKENLSKELDKKVSWHDFILKLS